MKSPMNPNSGRDAVLIIIAVCLFILCAYWSGIGGWITDYCYGPIMSTQQPSMNLPKVQIIDEEWDINYEEWVVDSTLGEWVDDNDTHYMEFISVDGVSKIEIKGKEVFVNDEPMFTLPEECKNPVIKNVTITYDGNGTEGE